MENIALIPIELVTLENGYHLMLTARVNGAPVRMLIDTGASLTCFDAERILELPDIDPDAIFETEEQGTGLGTNSMQSAFTELETFEVGALLLEDYPVIIIDMQHVNESYIKLGVEPIDGVLGSDFLLRHKAVIDYGLLDLSIMAEEPVEEE
ncbi:MAG: hypothetical protein EOL88_15195 [Bacteroidia bacterium]|jgi:hypothetical protein|nr:retroviral-like aspartic protease family protein [Bacteroidales bacterium]NCD43415.1 hypothetical protein [Bacteroidia bacterium]MDD2322591.1 retropepsin-like aspartic protease [Bacteroidales bacterium]MDD3011453.1 retropepsin-like aspartic protease [Bacteroidales bacterium]MDD3961886.1 retropepsin-like aspartic protease [Bacteroidales bacterium]